MFVLHIDLPAKPGQHKDLEQTFLNNFRPAISSKEGFIETQLLRSIDDETNFCLTIAFDKEESQQKWVETDLHQEVWPAIQDLCTEFSVRKYTATSDTD
jgi:heme-degrading monooxygenase HmoA